MDNSCNSGSIQSSSCGGDDEYDSRATESNTNISAAAFLNNPSRNHVVDVGPFTTTNNHLNPQHPSPPSNNHTTHIFHPSNYLDSIHKSSPNPFLNLDNMLWSKPVVTTPRSEPNQTDLSAFMLPTSSSSSSQQQNQAFLLSQLSGQSQTRGVNVSPLPPETSSLGPNNDQTLSNNNNNVRNPKKRSRASRRAPTTVLTTDTTNFRAMVQEFTGIPAPPFTSSPFPRTRLDLFGSASSTRSTFDPSPTPPYLLRPFAQKLQPSPSHPFQPSSSSMVENLASNNHNPQGDHLGLFNMHNSILGFQNISQPQPPKYPPGNSSKTQPSLEISPGNVYSHLKMGVLEELGLSQTNNIGALHQNMVSGTSSEGVTLMSRLNNNNNNNMRNSSSAGEWAQRMTSTIADNDRGILGSHVNYRSDNNIIQERVSNARGEPTVESWINCSSSD